MDGLAGGLSPAPRLCPRRLTRAFPKLGSRRCFAFAGGYFSEEKGLFVALAVKVVLQRRRVRSFPEKRTEVEGKIPV